MIKRGINAISLLLIVLITPQLFGKETTQEATRGLPEALVTNATNFWLTKEKEWGPRFTRDIHIIPLINEHNPQVCCEVGVAFGGQSLAILNKTQVKKLYSIDPYRPYRGLPFKVPAPNYWDVLWMIVRDRLKPHGERSTLIRKPSLVAAKDFPDASLDFIYIDGDHEYLPVLHDFHAWYPKMKPGGLIVGDDYGQPGVKRAVNEFAKAKKLQVISMSPRQCFLRKPL